MLLALASVVMMLAIVFVDIVYTVSKLAAISNIFC